MLTCLFPELREQLKSKELQRQRIIEAFQTTSQNFREVCCQLTGYRIDGLQNGNQYRLSPIYAESSDDFLLFQREESGECLLLETPFSTQLTELMDLHLRQQHSVPVFLAAVIMDLFSRHTFDTMEPTPAAIEPQEPQYEQLQPVAEFVQDSEPSDDNESEDEGPDEEVEAGYDEDEYADSEEESEDEEDYDEPQPGGGDDDDPICID